MSAEDDQHSPLDEYTLSEYRFQDERAEQVYTRASWQIGICAILAGSAYAVRRPEVLTQWTSNVLVFFYCLFGLLLFASLTSAVAFIAVAVLPGKYLVPGSCEHWHEYASSPDKPDCDGSRECRATAGRELLLDIAKSADENRRENRRRFKWLNRASKAIVIATCLAGLHFLFVALISISG